MGRKVVDSLFDAYVAQKQLHLQKRIEEEVTLDKYLEQLYDKYDWKEWLARDLSLLKECRVYTKEELCKALQRGYGYQVSGEYMYVIMTCELPVAISLSSDD